MRTSVLHARNLMCGLMILSGVLAAAPVVAQQFSYNPPGQLKSGSGTGRVDDMVYVPGMRYPIEQAPSFPNSQVWGRGGLNGGGGGQCDAENYSYPWWDNFCETRQWEMPFCPGGTGHQGQDIRPSTCEKDVHWAVAAEAGSITNIGSYSVSLTTPDGTRHRYLHMEPGSLLVSVGSNVAKGDRLGRVSNAFGGTPTTIHLHYDIRRTVTSMGPAYIPTYMSLVSSYEELIGMPAEPCGIIEATGGIIDDRDKCFRLAGNVRFWREVDGSGYDGRVYWTYAFTSANPGAWAQWDLDFAEAGEYRVEVYLTPMEATSKKARYVLRHDGSMDEISVDLSTDNDGWREIGVYNFAEGGGQSLSVYDNTGESSDDQLKIPADAIRLTRTDGPMNPPDMGTPPAQDMGTPPVQDMGTPPVQDMGSTPVNPPDQGSTPQPRPDMNGMMQGTDMGASGGGTTTEVSSTSSCGEGCGVLPSGRRRLPVELLIVGLVGWLGRRMRRRT